MLLSLSERVGRVTDSQPTEPTDSCVTGRRSNQLNYACGCVR